MRRLLVLPMCLLLFSGCSSDPTVESYHSGRKHEFCEAIRDKEVNAGWSGEFLYLYGGCQLEIGQPRRAEAAYERAISKAPYLHVVWVNWAIAAYQMDDLKKSRSILVTYRASLPSEFESNGKTFLQNVERELGEGSRVPNQLRISWPASLPAGPRELCATLTEKGYDHRMACRKVSGSTADLTIGSGGAKTNLYPAVFVLRVGGRPVAYRSFRPGLELPKRIPLKPVSAAPVAAQPAGCAKRPRTVALMVDSADWPNINILRSEGRLPNLDSLLTRGTYGILDSTPPFTAVAMRKMLTGSSSVRWQDQPLTTIWAQFSTLPLLNKIFQSSTVAATFGIDNIFDRLSAHGIGSHVFYVNNVFRVAKEGQKSERLTDLAKTAPGSEALKKRLDAIFAFADEKISSAAAELIKVQTRHEFETAAVLEKQLRSTDDGSFTFAYFLAWDTLSHMLHRIEDVGGAAPSWLALTSLYELLDELIGTLRASLCVNDTLIVLSDHGSLGGWQHHRDAFWVAVGPNIGSKALEKTYPIEKAADWFLKLAAQQQVAEFK